MNKSSFTLVMPVLAAAALSLVPVQAADPAPAPAAPPAAPAAEAAPDLSELDHAIPYAISVLEKKDYEAFVKAFVNPKMMEKMTQAGGKPADLAKGFEGKRGESILFAMKALKYLKPKMEEDGNLATYTLPPELVTEHGLRKSEIVFERVDKRWYIRN